MFAGPDAAPLVFLPAVAGMGAGHFIFIPAVLLVGIVIGWILGSRAVRDAYAAELRKREARRPPSTPTSPTAPKPPGA